MPKQDDLTNESYHKYLNIQVLMPMGDRYTKTKVVGCDLCESV